MNIFYCMVLFCFSLIYAADSDLSDFKKCFEEQEILVHMPADEQRFYATLHTMSLLEDWSKVVFHVGIISSRNKDVAERIVRRIRSLFAAIESESDCVRYADAQKALHYALKCDGKRQDIETSDLAYVQHQFFYQFGSDSFESAVPKLLVPAALQEDYTTVEQSGMPTEQFSALKSNIERRSKVHVHDQQHAIPVILIEEFVCQSAAHMFRSTYND